MAKNNSNRGKFFKNAKDYIPVCCHYDVNTLLTKDGELVQIIQINGINQENISMNLLGLREIIRNSLKKNVNTTNLSCWIHTVRRKENLDDPTEYPTILSQNIHDIWVRKNYWNDKFINTLFISFVYKGQDLKISNFQSFINSFKANITELEHNKYLLDARQKLEEVVSGVQLELNEFGAKRLGITFIENEAYCEMLSVLHGMIRFTEVPIKIENVDLSQNLGSFDYAVSNDLIEVISDGKRKYASILTIKEYQEVDTKTMDRVLQLPTEFIITEIFHFVEPKLAKEKIKYQHYITQVSKDEELSDLKGITTMLESEKKYKIPFCYQQLSMLVMNDDIDQLASSLSNASFQLSRVGLVHVKEDINIENRFWSQIPGNFKYLRKLNPMSVDTVASMASLHNFPAGSHTSPWGNAVTLLRSEKGTPYFFNFHSLSGLAKCLLIGNKKSGKTILANFLVSEALKFDPALLFIAYANDSQLFIKGNYGKWIEEPFKLDPFKIPDIRDNPLFTSQFIHAMACNNYNPLSEAEKISIDALIKFIHDTPAENRSFTQISEFDYAGSGEGGISLKEKLKQYLTDGEYYKYFIDDGLWDTNIHKISSISFANYTDEAYSKVHYPSEDKLIPEYNKKFEKFSTFRELLLYCNIYKFRDSFEDSKHIIKIENFNTLATASLSSEFYDALFDEFNDSDTIFISSIQFKLEHKFFESDLWQKMQNIFETKIYLPAEAINTKWKDKLFLSEHEFTKLKSLVPSSRLFIVKQDNLSITCELSLGGLVGLIKLLSPEQKIIDDCNKFIGEKGDEDPEKWLIEFYDSINL